MAIKTKTIKLDIFGKTVEVHAEQIEEGKIVTHRGKDIRIGQSWKLSLGEVTLGYVTRVLFTRERRTRGQRYVNARWQAPGWEYVEELSDRGLETASIRQGAESLYFEWRRNNR